MLVGFPDLLPKQNSHSRAICNQSIRNPQDLCGHSGAALCLAGTWGCSRSMVASRPHRRRAVFWCVLASWKLAEYLWAQFPKSEPNWWLQQEWKVHGVRYHLPCPMWQRQHLALYLEQRAGWRNEWVNEWIGTLHGTLESHEAHARNPPHH